MNHPRPLAQLNASLKISTNPAVAFGWRHLTVGTMPCARMILAFLSIAGWPAMGQGYACPKEEKHAVALEKAVQMGYTATWKRKKMAAMRRMGAVGWDIACSQLP